LTVGRVRIRTVRFKSGGMLRLIPSRRETISAEVKQDALAKLHDFWSRSPPVAGYALICWNTDGNTDTSVWNSTISPFANGMIPELVGECVRRLQVNDAINSALGQEDEIDA
jgi:hypothetical protein